MKGFSTSVFINSIRAVPHGGAVVTASNGSPDGPPSTVFEITAAEAKTLRYGDRLMMTIRVDFPDPPIEGGVSDD